MSLNPMTWEGGTNPRIKESHLTASCLMPMGITSENVAEKFGIGRQKQDEFASQSHMKAAAAQRQGKFKDEIIPVKTKVQQYYYLNLNIIILLFKIVNR